MTDRMTGGPRRTSGPMLRIVAAGISPVVCVLGLPEAIAGVWVNAGILAVVAAATPRHRVAAR